MADLTALFDSSRLAVDNVITVTLLRPASQSGGSAASITVANVLAEKFDQKTVMQPDGGSMDGRERWFRMWAADCASMPPLKGYRIVLADSTVWAIEEVETCAHGRSFHCHTRQKHNAATA